MEQHGHDLAAVTRRTSEILTDQLPAITLDHSSSADLCAHIAHYAASRDTLRIVAGRLVAETLNRGLSLREIADATGVPHTTLHRWAAPFRGEAQ